MKRLLDIAVSFLGLVIISPMLFPVMFLIWRQDGHSPFYIAPRVGKDGTQFSMVKLRSMVINADRSGVDSTSSNDQRITAVGHFIRRYKIDELPQLWNVLKGDMSLVGPRPNVKRVADLYTTTERKLLDVKPGITDFSSLVFFDEGDILKGHADPDIAYNQLIRPGKSRLGLFYIERQSFLLDIQLCLITVAAMLSHKHALKQVEKMIRRLGGDNELAELAGRRNPLMPTPPPGSTRVVTAREHGNPLLF